MLIERRFVVRVGIKGYQLVQNRKIAGFLDVGRRAKDQPQRIVVEAAAHVQVAALGQRLVLVVGAAVRELGGRDVQDALPGAAWDQVHKAQEVLRGIAEAHAPADARLKVGGGARHVEGDHALVLVPDVDHPVQLFVGALDLIV